jgi:hypothetical protein
MVAAVVVRMAASVAGARASARVISGANSHWLAKITRRPNGGGQSFEQLRSRAPQ